MEIAWLGNSRPKLSLEISQLAQVTDDQYHCNQLSVVKKLNRVVKYAADNPLSILFPKLNHLNLRLVRFFDASFANDNDFSSLLGYILFLVDYSSCAVLLHFNSYKSIIVTTSVMAAESISFSYLFDASHTMALGIITILGYKISLTLMTDSKSLFDVISKGTKTSGKEP
eukprot:IDg6558t1